MEISEIATLATSMKQSRNADAVQMAVQRKALEIDAQAGLQLIQAATPNRPSNPPHLGSRIDIYA